MRREITLKCDGDGGSESYIENDGEVCEDIFCTSLFFFSPHSVIIGTLICLRRDG